MSKQKRHTLLLILFFTNLLFIDSIRAQDSTMVFGSLCSIKLDKPKFSASLGTFLSNNSSGLSVGSEKFGVGVIINLEEALGLEKNSVVLRGSLNYNFGKRLQHGISLDYFEISRSSRKVLDTDISIEGYTFNIGDNIESHFNLSIIDLKYYYSILCDNRVDLALTGGVLVIPLNFNISSEKFESQNADVIAPLPVLGFSSRYLILKNLYMRQSTDLLYLTIDKYRANIIDLNLAIEHEPFKHFRYGIGINTFKINFHANSKKYLETNFFGDIDMDCTGILLYLKYCL